MGFKKVLPLYYSFGTASTPLAVSSTTTYTSPSTFVANLDNVGAQVTFSGTPTGTLSVLGSNDNANFFALTFTPPLTQPSGSVLTYGIDLNQFPWPYLQFQYVNASSSGGIIVSIFGKDLN